MIMHLSDERLIASHCKTISLHIGVILSKVIPTLLPRDSILDVTVITLVFTVSMCQCFARRVTGGKRDENSICEMLEH